MDERRMAELEAKGFKVGAVQEFLDLTDEEMEILELRVALVKALRTLRQETLDLSQETFAELIGSSQSRVAKMEAGDPSVSLDLLLKTLVRGGVTREEIGQALAAG